MSFGQPKPAKSRVPLGMVAGRSASAEVGVPVPVWWGTQRLGVQMIVEPFARFTRPVKSGGKKGGRAPVNNYATVVMAIGHGMLTALRQIWVNDELWYDGPLYRNSGENSVPITIDGFGSGTLYWGTETQPINSILAARGLGHTAYPGIAYMIFPGALLGQNQDTVPNFEVVASKCVPYIFSANTLLYHDQMQPIRDLVTNARFGRGRSASWYDEATLVTAEGILASEGMALCPMLSEGLSLRQFLFDFGAAIDGTFRTDHTGRLTVRLHREAIGVVPGYSEADFLSEPTTKPGSWVQTASAVQVAYLNGQKWWQRDTLVGADGGTASITGVVKQPVHEEMWIISPEVAQRVANVRSGRLGRPFGKGTVRLRPSRLGGLVGPGDTIELSYAHWGMVGRRARVTRMEIGEPGAPEVVCEVDFNAGQITSPFAGVAAYVPPAPTTLVPVVAAYQELWQIPSELSESYTTPAIALLCAQPSGPTDSFFGHLLISGGSYGPLTPDASTAFAVRASVQVAEPAAGGYDPDFRVTLQGVDVDLSRFATTDYALGKVIAKCGSELMTVVAVAPAGGSSWGLSVYRGAMGTAPQVQAVGAPVWLVQTDNLYTYPVPSATAGPVTVGMKIQPAIRRKPVALASCAALSITADPAAIFPAPPRYLRAFGSYTPVWTGVLDIPIVWIPTEPHGAIAVVLEFWDPAGPTLAATVTLPVGAEEYTWPYAAAVAALGGAPVTFEIRAAHRSSGRTGGTINLTVLR